MWQPASKTESYILKYRKYVNTWQRNERLAGLGWLKQKKSIKYLRLNHWWRSSFNSTSWLFYSLVRNRSRWSRKGGHDIKGLYRSTVVCSDRSFLHQNANKMTTIEAQHKNLSKETAKHHTARRRRARRNLKDVAEIPWCANYVCSENSYWICII